MLSVTNDPTKRYSNFEFIECAVSIYLGCVDRQEIATGLDGPTSDPKLFRTKVIESMSRAKEYLEGEHGLAALNELRSMFPGTPKILAELGLDT